jgi:hypothetical protein
MSPPPRSSKVRWSGIWDQQHNGVVLMVESICGQGFAYVREVKEDWAKHLVKLEQKDYRKQSSMAQEKKRIHPVRYLCL